MSRTRWTASSGPKISSSATREPGGRPSTTAGATKWPCSGASPGWMHARALVAGDLPGSAATRSRAARSITGGTSTPKRCAWSTSSASTAPCRRSSSVSAIRSCTSTRLAAEHFWPAKPNARVGERGDGVVEVGVGVDDHAVLAAHLGHDALEVALAGGQLRSRAEDLAARPRPDPVNAIVCTPGCATSAAPTSPSPGRKLSDLGRDAGRVQRLDDRERARRRLLGGLEHDAVAGRQPGRDHPGGDRQREVPRADDGDDAARRVAQRVALARQLDEPVRALERDRLLRVVLEEVDRLADVGVGLRPGLGALAHRERRERRAAPAQLAGGAREDRGAGVSAAILPRRRGDARGPHRGVDVGGRRGGRLRDDPLGCARVVREQGGFVPALAGHDHRHAPRELRVERGQRVDERLAHGRAA